MTPVDGTARAPRHAGLPATDEERRLVDQATLLLRYRIRMERRLGLPEAARPMGSADAETGAL